LSYQAIPPPTHTLNKITPVPILQELKEIYKLWHGAYLHVPRLSRYSIGAKIDTLFIELIELALEASYSKQEQKLTLLEQMSKKLDTLKYFLTVLWEMKGIEHNRYGHIATKLSTIGRMLGGWIKGLQIM
jgi:hypothetical protein